MNSHLWTAALIVALATPAMAQDKALLLFGGPARSQYAGCLNCGRYDQQAVCNPYGQYGSKYQPDSIWNPYGTFGSKYNPHSPWSRYGEGLRVVDEQGGYYGNFTSSRNNRSRLALIGALVEANEAMDDLDALRDLFCE